MASRRPLVCALAVALVSASPAASFAQTVASSNGSTKPANIRPANEIAIEAGRILIAGGLITYLVPAGWKPTEGSKTRVTIQSPDGVTGATCRVRLAQMPAPEGATQTAANTHILSQEAQITGSARKSGTLVEFSKSMRFGDVTVINVVRGNRTAYSEQRMFAVLNGNQLYVVSADCDMARPQSQKDIAGTTSFLDSAAVNRPL